MLQLIFFANKYKGHANLFYRFAGFVAKGIIGFHTRYWDARSRGFDLVKPSDALTDKEELELIFTKYENMRK